ncbi:cytochrome c oxidase subunit 4 [Mycobacterium sp. MYCO198283]|uniref:cytochrome c oxidase subunit 4 n=1 Tax=Mycobacterium sp. MYCO198283 TaxID=2883505 RepID=UPI001E5041A0|nr:cytochrome c oxidase subunit 4 [Mycobacterium sp. MYCO198283]MCG5432693.1 cytochrome c oxidase subunit 4 [Mycobacterium sp. MYCO198283]
MNIEARLFEILTAFFALASVVYAVLTALFSPGGVEWAGATALVLTTGLALIIATFFRFVARRLDTRPEDYEEAEIADGAGELGFFSPHSWWPISIALSGSVTAVGTALWLPWLMFAGVCFILATVAGLVFEYYIGPEKH